MNETPANEMGGGTAQPGAGDDPVATPPLIEHDLHGFCWCQPLVEEGPTGDRLYIHRRTLDSHIEREP